MDDLETALELYQHLGFVPGDRNGTTHQVIHAGSVTVHLSTDGNTVTFSERHTA